MKLMYERKQFNTPEFLEFVEQFKKLFITNMEKNSCKVLDFEVGHYYFSGYFDVLGHMFYFCWHNGKEDLLYRNVQNRMDFLGGPNEYIKIQKGVVDTLCNTLKQNITNN